MSTGGVTVIPEKGGGVASVNGLTGAIVLVAGSGITLTPSGNDITISSAGGGGSPAGPDTAVQFNASGSFGGSSSFTWDGTTLAVGANTDITNDYIQLGNNSGTPIVHIDANGGVSYFDIFQESGFDGTGTAFADTFLARSFIGVGINSPAFVVDIQNTDGGGITGDIGNSTTGTLIVGSALQVNVDLNVSGNTSVGSFAAEGGSVFTNGSGILIANTSVTAPIFSFASGGSIGDDGAGGETFQSGAATISASGAASFSNGQASFDINGGLSLGDSLTMNGNSIGGANQISIDTSGNLFLGTASLSDDGGGVTGFIFGGINMHSNPINMGIGGSGGVIVDDGSGMGAAWYGNGGTAVINVQTNALGYFGATPVGQQTGDVATGLSANGAMSSATYNNATYSFPSGGQITDDSASGINLPGSGNWSAAGIVTASTFSGNTILGSDIYSGGLSGIHIGGGQLDMANLPIVNVRSMTLESGPKIDTDGSGGFLFTGNEGHFGATAVGQQTAGHVTAGFTANTGTPVLSGSTFTGNVGSSAYTIGDLVAALKALGFIAT